MKKVNILFSSKVIFFCFQLSKGGHFGEHLLLYLIDKEVSVPEVKEFRRLDQKHSTYLQQLFSSYYVQKCLK